MHMHTIFSDGENTPEEMVKEAIKKGYKIICISDHVRDYTKWIPKYGKEINRLKKKYKDQITIFSAVEARIMNKEGDLCIPKTARKHVDFIMAAFHRIPKGIKPLEFWEKGLEGVLKGNKADIIAHPTNILTSLPRDLKYKIVGLAKSSSVCFEINSKYELDLPFFELLSDYGIPMIFGNDAHSVEEL